MKYSLDSSYCLSQDEANQENNCDQQDLFTLLNYNTNKLSWLLYNMIKIVKWRNCGAIYYFLPVQCFLNPWYLAKCLPSTSNGFFLFVCFLVFRKRIIIHQGHIALPWLYGPFLHCHFVKFPLPDERIFHATSP